MHIVLTFDAAYVPGASACIDSLLEHHEHGELHLWLVVAADVPSADRDALTRQVGGRARLDVLLAPEDSVAHLPLSSHDHRRHVSRATYLRLLLPDLLPPSVERFVYLDADTICLGRLDDLYAVALGGAVVGAVGDPYLSRLSDMEGVPGIEAWPHVDPQGPSMSPAVMVVDARAWRAAEVTQVALAYLEDPSHGCRYMDQDALNLALQGRWHRLPSRWGYSRTSRVESRWGGSLDGLRVLHFLGVDKPWQEGYPTGDRRELFRRHHSSALAAQGGGEPLPGEPREVVGEVGRVGQALAGSVS